MLRLNTKGWKLVDTICSNTSAIYPMKLAYESKDKTTFIFLGATVLTNLISILAENTEASTVAITIDNLAILALGTRIVNNSNNNRCEPVIISYVFSQLSILVISLFCEHYGAHFPTRMLSYLALGLYLESCSKLNK